MLLFDLKSKSMNVTKWSVPGVVDIIANLTPERLAAVVEESYMGREVIVEIPKFTMERSLPLKPVSIVKQSFKLVYFILIITDQIRDTRKYPKNWHKYTPDAGKYLCCCFSYNTRCGRVIHKHSHKIKSVLPMRQSTRNVTSH